MHVDRVLPSTLCQRIYELNVVSQGGRFAQQEIGYCIIGICAGAAVQRGCISGKGKYRISDFIVILVLADDVRAEADSVSSQGLGRVKDSLENRIVIRQSRIRIP